MSSQSSAGAKWDALRLQVLARDNYTCVYCGNEAGTVDHIIPKAKGGQDELTNLVACCAKCNSSKGDRTRQRLNWFDKTWLDAL